MKNTAVHDNLVTGDEDRARLSILEVASSHTIVAMVLYYVINRSIMETSQGVEFLTMRVKAPNTNEWEKVSHMIEYSRGTPVPGGENNGRLMCYVNETFVMQPNMLSYTGGELTMGKGSPVVAWGKPQLNMKSLIESELVGVKDMMPIIFWIRNFLLEQGERIVVDSLFDNKSPSPWEQNGKTPSWEKDNVCQREVGRNHYG